MIIKGKNDLLGSTGHVEIIRGVIFDAIQITVRILEEELELAGVHPGKKVIGDFIAAFAIEGVVAFGYEYYRSGFVR